MSPTMTTFDTSGEVRLYANVGEPGGARKRDWRWPDLSPFERGYVRAMFAGLAIWRSSDSDGPPPQLVTVGARLGRKEADREVGPMFHIGGGRQAFADELSTISFSNLAPETLARIMEDCERFARYYATVTGEEFRRRRQDWWRGNSRILANMRNIFPPLPLHLSDDGKVHFTP